MVNVMKVDQRQYVMTMEYGECYEGWPKTISHDN